jgi:hypothetical protein
MATRSTLKLAYQILSWSSLAILLVVVVLVLRKSPAPAVSVDPTAAARVEQKFQAADQAKAAGQPAQVQLSPTELNSYLSQNLDLSGAGASQNTAPNAGSVPAVQSPNANLSSGSASSAEQAEPSIEEVQSSVKDVKVDMDGDLVKAYVIFNLHGQDLSLELDGHLGAQDGYLKFDPVAGKLGSLPLPQSTLTAAVEKMMNSPENREKLKLPDDISDIHIQDGQAVVSYK